MEASGQDKLPLPDAVLCGWRFPPEGVACLLPYDSLWYVLGPIKGACGNKASRLKPSLGRISSFRPRHAEDSAERSGSVPALDNGLASTPR
jgi:hypothetical protein